MWPWVTMHRFVTVLTFCKATLANGPFVCDAAVRCQTLRMTGDQIPPAEATTTDRFANNWRQGVIGKFRRSPCAKKKCCLPRALTIIVVRCIFFLPAAG